MSIVSSQKLKMLAQRYGESNHPVSHVQIHLRQGNKTVATIHFLNVREGDCIVIQHNSGRVTMIDISCGNLTALEESTNKLMKSSGLGTGGVGGNFNMKAYPTKPQDYLSSLGIDEIWRFILTHPDMDHLDGFNALMDELLISQEYMRQKGNFGAP
ncbi:MAG: hypothetical protein KGN37_14900 [Burkholderiales bacterium]|nr:hypothetical protein [Burkholderiales bacterium]